MTAQRRVSKWLFQKIGISVESARLSRLFRDNLSRFFTKSLKTLGKKYFQTSPKRAETFLSDASSAPEAPRVPPKSASVCDGSPEPYFDGTTGMAYER